MQFSRNCFFFFLSLWVCVCAVEKKNNAKINLNILSTEIYKLICRNICNDLMTPFKNINFWVSLNLNKVKIFINYFQCENTRRFSILIYCFFKKKLFKLWFVFMVGLAFLIAFLFSITNKYLFISCIKYSDWSFTLTTVKFAPDVIDLSRIHLTASLCEIWKFFCCCYCCDLYEV